MSFGQVLARLRFERRIQQRVLGDYLNLSSATISNYENETHYPDLPTLCKIADFFHVTTDYLLGRTTIRTDSLIMKRTLIDEYTVADLVNTTIELDQHSMKYLYEYIKMLKIQENYRSGNNDSSV
jgi:transcriptional regulator with XRE-family HTH domain